MSQPEAARGRLPALTLGALGVVYGDIGTSPLYALRECFNGPYAVPDTHANILGLLSLILWSLLLIVSVKYLVLVTRANNRGEGGIMALLALVLSRLPDGRARPVLIAAGVVGAALLFGEGMLTPAITVLSAIEGLEVVTPVFTPYVLPLALGVIVGLFSFQRFGTASVGTLFGPVTLVWFLVLGVLGCRGILEEPGVLAAVNPLPGLRFLLAHGLHALPVLGAVFLAVTGVEALYADMGHFGLRPIRTGWFGIVLPALVLNYFGQGAWLMKFPEAVANPFFNLAPSWAVIPLVGLATAAAVIASQALISGAYSLFKQAMQLGFVPRLNILHTSSDMRGQIYIPLVNWTLLAGCLGLVLGFRSSAALAGAYGLGVSLTLLMTSTLLAFAARHVWGWPWWRVAAVIGVFVVIEGVFFAANSLKFVHGGWFPLLLAALLYLCMSTWHRGRALVRERVQAGALPLGMFLDSMQRKPPVRVPGTAVFMTGNPEGTPGSLLHNLKHNKVLHERTVILRFATADAPYVNPENRVQIEALPAGFYRVTGFFGFM
ncbi:MAG TPA: KUP/HAK/KT family potassium transporter, partial [Verrucomicrobiota bacterium]|nr:KUP/HAK/KT family potassium transporter [Verrucomicrobiota bacterium]